MSCGRERDQRKRSLLVPSRSIRECPLDRFNQSSEGLPSCDTMPSEVTFIPWKERWVTLQREAFLGFVVCKARVSRARAFLEVKLRPGSRLRLGSGFSRGSQQK